MTKNLKVFENDLKRLHEKLDNNEKKLKAEQAVLKDAQERAKRLKCANIGIAQKINLLKEEIAKCKKPGKAVTPKVSDHALVRYMERKFGVNTDELRSEILTPERESAIRMGAKKISGGGMTFIVSDDGTVVTCID